MLKIYCEYMEEPVGIDVKIPRFCWNFEPDDRIYGRQISYRILIDEKKENLVENKAFAWDSGQINSEISDNIPYSGSELKSGTTYYTKVCIQLENGNQEESSISSFTTGLMHDEWRENWIGTPMWTEFCCRYRKVFTVHNGLKNAAFFVASPNFNVVSVNGKKADDTVLNNATTDWDKTKLYRTYPVTELLEVGENVLGIECGKGWIAVKEGKEEGVGCENTFSAQLMLEYENGVTEWIYSDTESWYYSPDGPIRKNSLYDGETYDARCEMNGWDMPGYEMDARWKLPVAIEEGAGIVRAQYLEPIRIVKELRPVRIMELNDGSFTFDMGQNFAGWARIKISEPCGKKIVMKYAELIHEDGTVNQLSLRTAKATDVYISKGIDEAIYEPRFTYHGFRYVQVWGLSVKPNEQTLIGCQVRSDVRKISDFRSSNDLLNRIYSVINWTEESNLHGVPTDCPQRDERLGWLNDMTVRNECALYNYRLPALYTKWLQDIRDTQGKRTGAISDTAPFIKYGIRPADPVSSSFLLVPENIFLHYGDKRILEENYEAIKRWVSYLKGASDHYILRYSMMGDWAGPVGSTEPGSEGAGAVSAITPTILMATGFLVYDYTLLADMAKILRKKDEEKFYSEEAIRVKEAFNNKFYNKKRKYYAQNSQASNIFPLYLGIVPEEDRGAVLKNLVNDIKKHGTHLTTGNLCTRYALEVLFRNGEKDLAFQLLTQKEYPSWGYMIENGATTIWERWEKVEEAGPEAGMASHNHPMNGAAGIVYGKYLGGIAADKEQPGFRNIIIRPEIPKKLNQMEYCFDTIKGRISSSWEKQDNHLKMKFVIPFNCTAKIFIPVTNERKCVHSSDMVYKDDEFKFLTDRIKNGVFDEESSSLIVNTVSGEYEFVIDG